MQIKEFGRMPDGELIHEICLGNPSGFHVKVLTYGAIITRLMVEDKQGNYENVVLSYDKLEDYLVNPAYLGAIIGRSAGRIAGASCRIDGKDYLLDSNQNNNHLHGGRFGLHTSRWKIESVSEEQVILTCEDEYKHGKLPGNLKLRAIFRLTCASCLEIEYQAESDQDTYLNLTNHTYFNLSGKNKSIGDHLLSIAASHYTPIDTYQIPLTKELSVENTDFDFRKLKSIGSILASEMDQIKLSKGLDHPFRLDRQSSVIVLQDPISKRRLSLSTNQAYAVIYSGNYLHLANVPSGKSFLEYQGICFETQAIPNEINRRINQEEILLKKGAIYSHKTSYTFSLSSSAD